MSERELVLAKTDGHCAYCGCKLTLATLQVDHVEPMRRGDNGDKSHLDVLSNKMPSCRSCNYYKSTLTVEQFRDRMDIMINALERDSSTVKVLLRYGKIAFTRGPVEFYFEKLLKEATHAD